MSIYQDPLAGKMSGQESSLASWAGPYVTSMLGRGEALSNLPYTPYQGQLSAGAAPLQQQAFGGIAGLSVPTDMSGAGAAVGDIASRAGQMSFDPSTFTSGTFDTQAQQQYMNPFLQGALNPQLDEARRQAEMSRVGQAGRLSRAGAFGGSRQAIMESELDRNLQQNLANITGTGYRDAYDRAMQAFQTDASRGLQAQQSGEQSRQFGAGFGLDALSRELQARQAQSQMGDAALGAERNIFADQLSAGATQRGIESEGIAADVGQFEFERDYPYRQVQYMQSLLQGLPVGAQSAQYIEPSGLSSALGLGGGLIDLYDKLFRSKDGK